MATKARRAFTPEFKREAVALWETSGRPQVEIAAELGLQPSQLRRWQKGIHGPGPRPTTPASAAGLTSTSASASAPSPADLAAENGRLRRELDRARAERDILKKAIGIFS